MFKRKYVKISCEKVIQKIEDFLLYEGYSKDLHPIELYAFRYALDGMKLNNNNPSLIKRIRLNDIVSTFKSSKFIIFSENDNYGIKHDTDILDICSNLDKRMIFFKFSLHDTNQIEQIQVYLPSSEDTVLRLKNFFFYNFHANVYTGNPESDFIRDLSNYNKNLITSYIQGNNIVEFEDLNLEKEFFVSTNLNIEKSTITFHYIP